MTSSVSQISLSSCLGWLAKVFDPSADRKYAGIRSIFQRARAEAPCVLVLEDLDSLITDMNRSFFLNEVDGIEDNDGLLLVRRVSAVPTMARAHPFRRSAQRITLIDWIQRFPIDHHDSTESSEYVRTS